MYQIALTPKDIAILRGVSYATGKRELARLRVHYGKPHRAIITIIEYCHYHHVTEAEVRAALHRA